jgi:uncharacterized repeat protein (TIGR01451 family)
MGRALAGLVAWILVGLAGCSGGGGGGGSGGGEAALQYTGNTNPAVIDTSNAAVLTASASNTDASADVAGAFASVAPSQGPQTTQGSADVPWRVARRVLAAATKPTTNAALTSAPVNETDSCPNGGSVSINGDLTPGGTGTVNVTFRNCGDGGDFISGTATVRIDRATNRSAIGLPPLPTLFTVSFARLNLRGSASIDLGGSVSADINLNTETITENAVVLDLDSGVMTKAELTVVTVGASSFTKTINGRVFHSAHGFVTITTNVPLAFASPTQPFPQSGELVLTGSNGARILVTALSPIAVKLSLNLDNLPGFERVVTLAWTDLSGPAGSDLRDSDTDGMHDSWEVVYGLNPNDASDKFLDKDGDGALNLTEYLNGSKPNDPTSLPTTVSLSLGVVDSPDPVTANSPLTYTITVANSSQNPAHDVVLFDLLPAGVVFVSAQATQGTCNPAISSVSCTLNTINPFASASVTVAVTPTVAGTLSNTAAVASREFERNVADNNVTTLTTVN